MEPENLVCREMGADPAGRISPQDWGERTPEPGFASQCDQAK